MVAPVTRRELLSSVLCTSTATLVGCSQLNSATNPRIEAPTPKLVDQPIAISLTGFPANVNVIVRASTEISGRRWESRATFSTDSNGNADLSAQRPDAGTYDRTDGMGLIWSLKPVASDRSSSSATAATTGTSTPASTRGPATGEPGPRTRTVQLRAFIEGETRASASTEIVQRLVAPDVTMQPVGSRGLVGRFYVPGGEGPHLGVVTLHGSGGVPLDGHARLLASHGYATLALQYFGAPGLRETLSLVPLEYFETAMDWLTDHEAVTDGEIGVLGGSKGGELALLLASRYSEIGVVIGYAPSAYVFQGLGGATSSWASDGEPLPYVSFENVSTPEYTEEGYRRIAPVYESAVKRADPQAVRRAVIRVERSESAVLLISGGADALWPSTFFARKAIDRLERHEHPNRYDHLTYANAGHGISYPYQPTTTSTAVPLYGGLALGGTPAANAAAAAESWPHVLQYLNASLN